jgi:NhaA family Na+:H+ antiporter
VNQAPDGARASHPPETWRPARRAAQAVFRPIERFLHVQAASGILLLAAALLAITWANSPWRASYDHLWHMPLSIGVGQWSIERDLHFWINELLMTVFFLLVGLEIKREMVHGALASVRSAALPIAAALGGMIVPAAIYFALNPVGPGSGGWGVAMATDIAFAVGVLTLLGKRVHPTLRVLLLAFAIIDDIGAILVIAVFYSSGIAVQGLVVAGGGLVLALVLLWIGVRPGPIFTVPLLVMWAGLYVAGIHPTIAGVVMGLAIPARAWFGADGFVSAAKGALDDFRERAAAGHGDHDLLVPLGRIAEATREAVAPGVRAEAALHPWVAFGIMPLFALANAGVDLQGVNFAATGASAVFFGVLLGLLVGKPAGVLLAAWIAVRLRLSVLPQGVTWRSINVVGAAAAIGFTMAIFIAELAFGDPDLLAVAKLGILAATGVAGAAALLGGVILLPRDAQGQAAAVTETAAEVSAAWAPDSGTG